MQVFEKPPKASEIIPYILVWAESYFDRFEFDHSSRYLKEELSIDWDDRKIITGIYSPTFYIDEVPPKNDVCTEQFLTSKFPAGRNLSKDYLM